MFGVCMYMCVCVCACTQVVDPKREALKLAESDLAAQEARLAQARQRLADINATIQVRPSTLHHRQAAFLAAGRAHVAQVSMDVDGLWNAGTEKHCLCVCLPYHKSGHACVLYARSYVSMSHTLT